MTTTLSTTKLKSDVRELLQSIETRDSAPMAYINAAKFKQHNLTAKDGVEGFAQMLKSLDDFPEPARVTTVRVLHDGDYVVAHSIYNLFGDKIGFDVFRFEDGLIVEHWDNLQPMPAAKNPSNRTMTDGAVKICDSHKREQNRALIEKFADEILIKGNMQNIGRYFNGDKYTQHNPAIGDGLATFGKAAAQMAAEGLTMSFSRVHKTLADGNFVLLISEGLYGEDGGVPTSFYDLFRIEDDKIVEHWDVIEPIIPAAQRQNSNGKFGFK